MKNSESWEETKYHIDENGNLSASKNPSNVSPASWLFANIIAKQYEYTIPKFVRGNLLDLGCGNVPLYGFYKKYISNCVCLDWENTEHKNQYLDFSHDITSPLPFADETFDTIILADVLEHIPTPQNLIKEMTRVLNKDGRIIMSTPFLYWIHEKPFDYYRYTEHFYHKQAEENNLSIEYIEKMGGGCEVLSDIFGKVLSMIGFPSLLIRLQQHVAYSFYMSRIGKKLYNGTKNHLTLGYFVILVKNT